MSDFVKIVNCDRTHFINKRRVNRICVNETGKLVWVSFQEEENSLELRYKNEADRDADVALITGAAQ